MFKLPFTILCLSLASCSLTDTVDPHSPVACVSREGECFDLQINGVNIVAISNESKDLLKSYRGKIEGTTMAEVLSTAWETSSPISGKLNLTARFNKRGSIWFGKDSGLAEPIILGIDGQKLRYSESIESSAPGDPRGVALLAKTLAQDTLPSGNYIFVVTYTGDDNWDRKYVLVNVK